MTCIDTPDELPEVPLRIDRGQAEPEELAALTVILGAHLVGLRALEENHRRRQDDQQHIVQGARCACWSGCWCCS
ncbi:acyl-CoA carboxylase subunit epsilon [Streptomyces sp. NPDC101227]|uniref:acyl-CoA carboxylase subunit epsilon n=1 Tax=Streptomyces sp. NPDC101227 TaxID=3366136 RepID=UPI003827713E